MADEYASPAPTGDSMVARTEETIPQTGTMGHVQRIVAFNAINAIRVARVPRRTRDSGRVGGGRGRFHGRPAQHCVQHSNEPLLPPIVSERSRSHHESSITVFNDGHPNGLRG